MARCGPLEWGRPAVCPMTGCIAFPGSNRAGQALADRPGQRPAIQVAPASHGSWEHGRDRGNPARVRPRRPALPRGRARHRLQGGGPSKIDFASFVMTSEALTCKRQRAYEFCTRLFYRVMRPINLRIYIRASGVIGWANLFANSARGRGLKMARATRLARADCWFEARYVRTKTNKNSVF